MLIETKLYAIVLDDCRVKTVSTKLSLNDLYININNKKFIKLDGLILSSSCIVSIEEIKQTYDIKW